MISNHSSFLGNAQVCWGKKHKHMHTITQTHRTHTWMSAGFNTSPQTQSHTNTVYFNSTHRLCSCCTYTALNSSHPSQKVLFCQCAKNFCFFIVIFIYFFVCLSFKGKMQADVFEMHLCNFPQPHSGRYKHKYKWKMERQLIRLFFPFHLCLKEKQDLQYWYCHRLKVEFWSVFRKQILDPCCFFLTERNEEIVFQSRLF